MAADLPVDAVNMNEAAHILGVDRSTLARWLVAGRLTSERSHGERLFIRAEVEALALARYPVARPSRDPDSYWVNTKQAAELLGVVRSRVQQLVAKDRLPYAVTPSGVRLFRRHQLEVVGTRERQGSSTGAGSIRLPLCPTGSTTATT